MTIWIARLVARIALSAIQLVDIIFAFCAFLLFDVCIINRFYYGTFAIT